MLLAHFCDTFVTLSPADLGAGQLGLGWGRPQPPLGIGAAGLGLSMGPEGWAPILPMETGLGWGRWAPGAVLAWGGASKAQVRLNRMPYIPMCPFPPCHKIPTLSRERLANTLKFGGQTTKS